MLPDNRMRSNIKRQIGRIMFPNLLIIMQLTPSNIIQIDSFQIILPPSLQLHIIIIYILRIAFVAVVGVK